MMQRITIFFLLTIIFLLTFVSCKANRNKEIILSSLQEKADTAMVYCKEKGFDTNICILIDMKIHPGKNRLFVWDFNKDTVIHSGLCCHGAGGKSTVLRPEFSNIPGSNCTSLGKYKIGKRSYSKWGINVHYKLHGLEKTNDKAFERIVVLHSHTPVPNKEIYPLVLPMGYSLGCPVVSNEMMKIMDELFKKTKKPVLLWIYY